MKPLWRVLSFLEQWAADLFSQPLLLFTLIVAPFLLLLAFGTGIELGGPRPRTVIVVPPNSEQAVAPIVSEIETYVDVRGIEESLPLARAALERGDIDAVVVVPGEIQPFLDRGERIPLQVLLGEIDPVRRSYARAFLRDQVGELNRFTIRETVAEAQVDLPELQGMTAEARAYLDLLDQAQGDLAAARDQLGLMRQSIDPVAAALDRVSGSAREFALAVPGLAAPAAEIEELRTSVGDLQQRLADLDSRLSGSSEESALPSDAELAELRTSLDRIDELSAPLMAISPEVISAPFRLELNDVTPVEPTFTAFYSPGMLALLLQHLAITFGALSLASMRLLRVTEMLRASPIRAGEVLTGNYLAYGLLCAVAAAGLLGLLVYALDVPVSGSWGVVVLTLTLLVLCSLGIGFIASLVASSLQQATQIAMLTLLGSIFFSGFAFSLDQMVVPARWLSVLFPATYGIRTLQDVMLRGVLRRPEDLIILGVAALGCFVVALMLMRRELQPR